MGPLGGGTLGQEGRALTDGISAIIKEGPEKALAFSAM